MISIPRNIPALLSLVVLIGPMSPAQDKGEFRTQWQSMAWVGYNGSMPAFAMTAGVEARYRSGANLYIAHIYLTQELKSFGGGHGAYQPDERITGSGLMYGRVYEFSLSRPLFPLFPLPWLLSDKATEYRAAAAVGLSFDRSILREGPIRYYTTDGVLQSTHDPIARTGIGLPIQIELTQMLTTSVGYVHRAYVNVNQTRIFWTVSWAIEYSW